ncbi:MAG: exodeoxyribonuclease VII small subunit [bacterium]|nr:exodeoxyribonuclease VII small subunit [bacterium]
MSKNKDPFEKTLSKLEEIVRRLEEGNLPLEESLALYEEGKKLAKICQERLEEARGRIEVLEKGEEGQLVGRPFESNLIEPKS